MLAVGVHAEVREQHVVPIEHRDEEVHPAIPVEVTCGGSTRHLQLLQPGTEADLETCPLGHREAGRVGDVLELDLRAAGPVEEEGRGEGDKGGLHGGGDVEHGSSVPLAARFGVGPNPPRGESPLACSAPLASVSTCVAGCPSIGRRAPHRSQGRHAKQSGP